MKPVTFTVPGRPRPQGSKRPVRNQHTGRIHLVEQSRHLLSWRERVAFYAHQVSADQFRDVAVSVTLTCFFERPKSQYRTGRFSAELKPGAPAFPITRSTGDADKLARAVLDALKPSVLADDSLVCHLSVSVLYGTPERLVVDVGALGPVAA